MDCREVFTEVIANLGETMRQANLEIAVNQRPTIQERRTKIALLFQNLLGNAVTFRRPGVPPRVTVSAERLGREALALPGLGQRDWRGPTPPGARVSGVSTASQTGRVTQDIAVFEDGVDAMDVLMAGDTDAELTCHA